MQRVKLKAQHPVKDPGPVSQRFAKVLSNFCQQVFLQFSTVRPEQNGRHLPDGIFKYIFFDSNVSISIEISLKFVPKCLIDNKSALVQVMAWHQMDKKLLTAPMIIRI